MLSASVSNVRLQLERCVANTKAHVDISALMLKSLTIFHSFDVKYVIVNEVDMVE